MRPRQPFVASSVAFVLAVLALLAATAQERPQDAAKVEELSADHSLAVVTDREGVATVRPAGHERALCAETHARLFANDWIATGARGANALAAKLKNGATLILGPGAQIELLAADRLRVDRGEVEVGASEKAPVTVEGPGGASLALTRKAALRARDGKLVALDDEPKWLAGYKAGQSTEALGSLLATVDGRSVPLTIGVHLVEVDVRDQIARTTIEETFVNHTDRVLEGVFYFPLPADASISSFGMWIGDELVEGDIVEKERAREIYETILREKRDPGLLEWSGGNLFKARVYPIGGEKRVKLSYTQVLPKEGDTWSYHYALQSELLRLHPLAKLALNVKISSAEPLAAVVSPSHSCRIQRGDHSATAEFTADEYAPDRDFELRVATRPSDGALTFIGDRRAEDGYFLARFRAPAADPAAAAQAEQEPVDLIVLADTSGSLAGPARTTQIEFVEALLASLSPRDTFQLATCDVETRLAFVGSVANTEENRAAALRFLEERDALGWSDLATGLKTVLTAARPKSQIVYVGDGIPTLGDADPALFAQQVPSFFQGRGTVHAVVPGNTSEPLVLRALSQLGGGSLRSIGGGTDPAQTATALLSEITTPAAKGLALTIDGLAVAAVYPEVLPNLPAGREQVIVGRFDPQGGTHGSFHVRGSCDGKPVTFEAEVDLSAATEGQSFVPRLWARQHLDHLLAQGPSAANRRRIVALSEDFQIATPYTSFLVLESEADRQRFAVQKRTRMRDGEEFFAKGRADATFELLKQQMQKSALWHRDLRADLLDSLKEMDRSLTEMLRSGGNVPRGDVTRLGAVGFQRGGAFNSPSMYFGPMGGGGGGGGRGGDRGRAAPGAPRSAGRGLREHFDSGDGGTGGMPEESESLTAGLKDEESSDFDEPAGADDAKGDDELDDAAGDDESFGFNGESKSKMRAEKSVMRIAETAASPALRSRAANSLSLKKLGYLSDYRGLDDGTMPVSGKRPAAGSPLDAIFPAVAPPPAPPALDDPRWPDAVKELLRALDRSAIGPAGALHVTTTSTSIDTRGRNGPPATADWLLSDGAWCTTSGHQDGDAWTVEWLKDGTRGVWRNDWNVGRRRPAQAADARSPSHPFPWMTLAEFSTWRGFTATLKELGDGKVELAFESASSPKSRFVLTIDRAKAVVVEARWQGETPSGTTRFGGFVEVAGRWWPTTVETLEADGRVVETTAAVVEALDAAAFRAALDRALAPRAELIELGPDATDLDLAKQHAAQGSATLEERWLLLVAAVVRADAAAIEPAAGAFRTLVAGRFGLVRIELALLLATRRHEELRHALLREAAALVAAPRAAELALEQEFQALAAPLAAGQERLELLTALDPVVRRHPTRRDVLYGFEQQVLQNFAQLDRLDELAQKVEKAANDWSDRVDAQLAWSDTLVSRGELDRALAWLDHAQKDFGPWSAPEIEQFENTRQNTLWNGYRLEELVARVAGRLERDPEPVNEAALDMYLSALVMLDRQSGEAALVTRWLADGRAEKPSDGAKRRVNVAVRHALYQGYAFNGWNHRFEDDEARALADTARDFATRDVSFPWAQQILAYGGFRATPAARALLAEFFAATERGIDARPAAEVVRDLNLLRSAGRPEEAETARWHAMNERLLARFKAAAAASPEAVTLSNWILSTGETALIRELWRTELARATTPAARRNFAAQLLASRLGDEWDEAAETEVRALLPELWLHVPVATEGDAAQERSARAAEEAQAIVAWHDFVDWAVERRVDKEVNRRPDSNLLPRRKLATLRDELRKEARLAVRTLLVAAAQAPERGPADWLDLDRMWLDVRMRRELAAARSDAQALLDREIAATKATAKEQIPVADAILAARAAATLLQLLVLEPAATRTAPDAELARRFADAIAANHPLADWRGLEWSRLVALDRGAELEARLAEWYGAGDDFTKLRFGRDLARIHAERGRLAEATALSEELAKREPLPAEDALLLADWYTALGRKDDAARAKVAAWSAQEEWELGQRLNVARGRAHAGDTAKTAAVDADLPDQLAVLMRKAQWPQNWLWQLQDLYATTKDFRILQCLPDAVLGHTAQGIYDFLQGLAGTQNMIEEEATVDRINAAVAAAAPRATTAVDRRALALLQFLAEYRASAQKNGGAPHARTALSALQTAFAREWADGEPRLYAQLLAHLGPFAGAALQDEQFRQVRELSGRVAAGTPDRLAIVDSLAALLWAANRREAALDLLGAELNALRAAHGGRCPDWANEALSHVSGYLQASGAWLAAEKVWLDEIAAASNAARRNFLETQLHQLWNAALVGRGTTSLGSGDTLYAAAQKALLAKLAVRSDEGHAQELVQALAGLWQSAKQAAVRGVADDVRRFAFDGLPSVLSLYQYRGGQALVATTGQAVLDAAGYAAAVEFLVTRAENEARWLDRVGQSFFDQLGWQFVNWRHEARRLDDGLDARALALVLKELALDLRYGRQRARGVYDARYDSWWKEKAKAFGATARAVLAEAGDDEAVTLRIADYQYFGLRNFDAGIATLAERHRLGRLGLDGQALLVGWLEERSRWKEALPLALLVAGQRPDDVNARIPVLRALNGLRQRDELAAACAAIEAHLREKKLWDEVRIAPLAAACVDTDLHERAAAYFDEAIALHVKANPNRGVGDGTLAMYYGRRAQSLVALGRTADAVDSAAGAVITWSRDEANRNEALKLLQNVLRRAEDLDAYAAHLDEETKKSGLDNPTIRRALGQVYFEESNWAAAATQLAAALETQPNDPATQRLLVTTYDRLKQPQKAVAQLTAALEVTGHDVALTRELGDRLAKLGDDARAERVRTNLVEMMAQESESHAALAEIRESQQRLAEGAEQWRQVVRIRSKEPTGYLGLARVLVRMKDRAAAREVIDQLLSGTWDKRFGDVKTEARSLERQLAGKSF